MIQKFLLRLSYLAIILIFNPCLYAMEEADEPLSLSDSDSRRDSLEKSRDCDSNKKQQARPLFNPDDFFKSTDSSSMYLRQRTQNATRPLKKFDEQKLKKIIDDAPQQLQQLISVLKNRASKKSHLYLGEMDYYSPMIILTGPPGVGKSSLASAIPQYCGIDGECIIGSILSDQYQYSGESKLNDIFQETFRLKEPHFLILDEMNKIIKHENNTINSHVAEALWALLDQLELSQHVIFIATTNDLKDLPEQLTKRISDSCYNIPLPTREERHAHIQFLITRMSPTVTVNLSDRDINDLAKATDGFAQRELYKMFRRGNMIVGLNKEQKEKEDDNNSLTIELHKHHLLAAMDDMKKNGDFKSWQIRAYEFIEPAIGTILVIGIPLLLNYGFSSIQQYVSYNQAERFHTDTQTQSSQSLSQAQKFHEEQRQDHHVQMILDGSLSLLSYLSSKGGPDCTPGLSMTFPLYLTFYGLKIGYPLMKILNKSAENNEKK